jgi:hypothetical protein
LLSANINHQSELPWAVPLMAIYLWLYWRYLVQGAGWPASTAEARRNKARANALPHEAWGRLCWRDCSASQAYCSFRER